MATRRGFLKIIGGAATTVVAFPFIRRNSGPVVEKSLILRKGGLGEGFYHGRQVTRDGKFLKDGPTVLLYNVNEATKSPDDWTHEYVTGTFMGVSESGLHVYIFSQSSPLT